MLCDIVLSRPPSPADLIRPREPLQALRQATSAIFAATPRHSKPLARGCATSQENVELTLNATDAFNARDVDAAVALFTEDCLWIPAMEADTEGDRTDRGHSGLRQYYRDLAEFSESHNVQWTEVHGLGDGSLPWASSRCASRAAWSWTPRRPACSPGVVASRSVRSPSYRRSRCSAATSPTTDSTPLRFRGTVTVTITCHSCSTGSRTGSRGWMPRLPRPRSLCSSASGCSGRAPSRSANPRPLRHSSGVRARRRPARRVGAPLPGTTAGATPQAAR